MTLSCALYALLRPRQQAKSSLPSQKSGGLGKLNPEGHDLAMGGSDKETGECIPDTQRHMHSAAIADRLRMRLSSFM